MVQQKIMEDKKQLQRNKIPLYAVNLASFLLAVLCIGSWSCFVYWMGDKTNRGTNDASEFASKTIDASAFEKIHLAGKSAVVWDISNKKTLFAKNAKDQLPLASITKLMTVLVASDILPPYFSIDNPGDVKDKWSLGDIISFTLVTSSNSGAGAIAAAVDSLIKDGNISDDFCADVDMCDFVTLMNKKALDIGLEQTYFTNPTGLDSDSGGSGGYGSAVDVAKLISYIYDYKPDILKPTSRGKYLTVNKNGYEIEFDNTNPTVETIPGIIGSKTGLTDFAGGNLTVIFDAGFDEPYAVVTLGSTEEERFTDVAQMIEATREFLVDNNK